MLRLQVDQPEIRVAHRAAFTYAVQRNPQKKSVERRRYSPSLGGLPFAQEWLIRALLLSDRAGLLLELDGLRRHVADLGIAGLTADDSVIATPPS
jgi:hypothetical protein